MSQKASRTVIVVLALLSITSQSKKAAQYNESTQPCSNGSSVKEAASTARMEDICFPQQLKKIKSTILKNLSCKEADVLRCYCLTSTINTMNVHFGLGHCLYGCFITENGSEYHEVSIVNYDRSGTCTLFNRTGLLCGSCRNNTGPAAYSFSLKCVPCSDETVWRHMLHYVAVAYGPLTVFLVIIVVFSVSVNSAPLHGWMFVCQIISSSSHMRTFTSLAEINHSDHYSYKIMGTIYGIWNLDFFRSVYHPFCLHPGWSTLQVMSLDYLIAAYPLVVIVLVYALVELHSRDYRPVVAIWRPFHYCFARFRHQLDIRTSLVDAFGTFFSLSYVKMLSTTVDLMIASEVWMDDKTPQLHMYYDGNMQFFKGEHIPFGVIGITIFFFCNVLPLILIVLYSFRQTQKFFNFFPSSFTYIFRPFMECLLGCYKDGTNGTRNCRCFAIVYHIARIALYACFLWTESPFYYTVATYTCILTGLLVAIIQPYKSAVYNTLDTGLILTLALGTVGVSAYFIANVNDPLNVETARVMCFGSLLLPLFYAIGYVTYHVYATKKLPHRCLKGILYCLLSVLRCARKLKATEMADLSERTVLIQRPTHSDVCISSH